MLRVGAYKELRKALRRNVEGWQSVYIDKMKMAVSLENEI